jgi:hypothetical protein
LFGRFLVDFASSPILTLYQNLKGGITMKKLLLIIISMLCMLNTVHTETVSQKEAEQVATLWFRHISGIDNCEIREVTTWSENDLVTFYICHFNPDGFVIVAANDASIPILGYSAENSFPSEKKNGKKSWKRTLRNI